MKTTISLPDEDHRRLRKLAIDRSTTMADLILGAVRERYFDERGLAEGTGYDPLEKKPPLVELRGFLSDVPSTEEEVMGLEKIWNRDIE